MINPRAPALYGLTGELMTQEPGTEIPEAVPSDLVLTRTDFRVEQMSIETAVALNLGDLVASDIKDAHSFFLMQYAFKDPALWIRTFNQHEVGVIYGSALRIGVTVKNLKSSASANLGLIAANTKYDKTQVQMIIHTEGMDNELSNLVTRQTTNFDPDAIGLIGKTISVIQSEIRKNPSLLKASKLEMMPIPSVADSDYLQAVSNAYALQRIKEDQNYDNAEARLLRKVNNNNTDYFYQLVNTALLKATYQKMLGDYNNDVCSEATKTAKQLFNQTSAQ